VTTQGGDETHGNETHGNETHGNETCRNETYTILLMERLQPGQPANREPK
jgi:hypothetical protein